MDTENHEICCQNCYDSGYKVGHREGFTEAPHQGKRVLTDDAVREIRRQHSAGTLQKVLAAEYGVTTATISRLCRRETYYDVL